MKDTIVVTTDGPVTEKQQKQISNAVQEACPEKAVIVKSDDFEIHELPALDDYAEELAKRVAKEIKKDQ